MQVKCHEKKSRQLTGPANHNPSGTVSDQAFFYHMVCNLLLLRAIFLPEDVLKTIFIAFALFATVSAACAGDSFYTIQVLMTSNLVSAEHAYDKIKKYKNARLEKTADVFVVRAGTFKNRDKALPMLKQLRKAYPDAFIKVCAENGKPPAKKTAAARQKKARAPQPPPRKHPVIKEEKIVTPSRPDPPVPAVTDKPAAVENTTASSEDSLKTGVQHYRERKYESAIRSLLQYISLSPGGNQHASALLVIGKSLAEINRTGAALRIFSRIIAQYPDGTEATAGKIAIADIGVANPAIKYPMDMNGAEYLRDPILAYDAAAAQNMPDGMMEHIQYQKGLFLQKTGRYREACDVYTAFLKAFPKTSRRKEIVGMLKADTIALINQYHQAGDHLSASNLFLQAKEKWLIGPDDKDTYMKAALSFAHLGLFTASSGIIKTLRIYEKNKASSDIDKVAAEIEGIKLSAVRSEMSEDSKWRIFQSGREHLKSKNLPLAEQTLGPLKNPEGDAFWTRLTEYVLEDNAWAQKYRKDQGNN
jgi:TolA-binding protein